MHTDRNPPRVGRGVVILLTAVAILTYARIAGASWWGGGTSVSSFDIRGIALGMTLDEVSKQHPEMRVVEMSDGDMVNGRFVKFEQNMREHSLRNDNCPITDGCLIVNFTTEKFGSKVSYVWLRQKLPYTADIEEIFSGMEKKYGSPDDKSISHIMSNSIVASWGMNIADSSGSNHKGSGQALVVSIEKFTYRDVEVSMRLEDFSAESSVAKLAKTIHDQKREEEAKRGAKALNY